jgi:hypothetical protein
LMCKKQSLHFDEESPAIARNLGRLSMSMAKERCKLDE